MSNRFIEDAELYNHIYSSIFNFSKSLISNVPVYVSKDESGVYRNVGSSLDGVVSALDMILGSVEMGSVGYSDSSNTTDQVDSIISNCSAMLVENADVVVDYIESPMDKVILDNHDDNVGITLPAMDDMVRIMSSISTESARRNEEDPYLNKVIGDFRSMTEKSSGGVGLLTKIGGAAAILAIVSKAITGDFGAGFSFIADLGGLLVKPLVSFGAVLIPILNTFILDTLGVMVSVLKSSMSYMWTMMSSYIIHGEAISPSRQTYMDVMEAIRTKQFHMKMHSTAKIRKTPAYVQAWTDLISEAADAYLVAEEKQIDVINSQVLNSAGYKEQVRALYKMRDTYTQQYQNSIAGLGGDHVGWLDIGKQFKKLITTKKAKIIRHSDDYRQWILSSPIPQSVYDVLPSGIDKNAFRLIRYMETRPDVAVWYGGYLNEYNFTNSGGKLDVGNIDVGDLPKAIHIPDNQGQTSPVTSKHTSLFNLSQTTNIPLEYQSDAFITEQATQEMVDALGKLVEDDDSEDTESSAGISSGSTTRDID